MTNTSNHFIEAFIRMNTQCFPYSIIVPARWKTFYDRAFFWNHTPSLVGKQLGYLISGPLDPNLVQILEASLTTWQDANHAGIVTDECTDSIEPDNLLQNFADRLLNCSVNDYTFS
ncbi:MAG: hypothetical protein KAI40_07475 [Desulfobacterales bacterium]|nr:hypothetical protein [Desulfobacterales bacterium]